MDRRISRHQAFMQTAEVWSRRSTCFRRNVGCVIARGKNIVAIGYNGPPPGEPHCLGVDCIPPGMKGCQRSVHAELNALDRLSMSATFKRIDVMYITESPCPECAEALVKAGIAQLFYLHPYRVTEGVDYVAKNMPVYRMTPAGLIIRHGTEELVDTVMGE